MSIEIKNITKIFSDFKALDNVDLKIETGSLIAFLGPSGSGKTTLLRIIAGLEYPDSGGVFFHGEDASQKKTKDRHVGFVFQHYALFRHMTVFDNIAFGLRVKPRAIRPSEDRIKARVLELLKLVQLDWVAARYPSQLSGGQRQRIALARALAIEPKVLLLDEPFGSLDAQVRKELRQWLRRFHDDLNITTLFVTHDQEEALEVADRIVVMNKGKIEQTGTPEDVYHHPASTFVLNFLGNVNIFHERIVDGKKANVYIRPNQFDVSRTKTSEQSIEALIRFINQAGSMVKLDLTDEQGRGIQVEIPPEEYLKLNLKRQEKVFVTPKNIIYYDYDI